MKVCKEIEEWFEEKIEQEIRKQEQRCKKWPWPLSWFCSLVTFIIKVVVTIVRKVVRVVCEIITVVVNLASAVVNLILAIPILGPAIKAFIRLVTGAASIVLGLLDGAGRLFGVRITKHLRVHVVPLCEGIIPLAYEQHLAPIMRETERILYARAQIRVHTTFHEPIRNPPETALRLGTNVDLMLDEAWLKGTWHQVQALKLFESNFWSVLGIGHPVIVYVIREVGYDGPGTVVGASGGPIVDWVAIERDTAVKQVVADAAGNARMPVVPFPPTVAGSGTSKGVQHPQWDTNKYTVAHEICHALGLLFHANSQPGDLMYDSTLTGDALSPFQVGLVRSSAHVTFL